MLPKRLLKKLQKKLQKSCKKIIKKLPNSYQKSYKKLPEKLHDNVISFIKIDPGVACNMIIHLCDLWMRKKQANEIKISVQRGH